MGVMACMIISFQERRTAWLILGRRHRGRLWRHAVTHAAIGLLFAEAQERPQQVIVLTATEERQVARCNESADWRL
jgi:hypothetical protein